MISRSVSLLILGTQNQKDKYNLFIIVKRFEFFCLIFVAVAITVIKSRQCKAGRERFTPYQSKDPSPTIPRREMK